MTDTIKFRLIGDRDNVKAMIGTLDPVLDTVTDWRIFPQRNGIGVSAYLEARPRAREKDTYPDAPEGGSQ